MSNKSGNSKTDVIIKLVLVFFISLLSFSIGTFVGKKFSDNQHKISHFEPTSSEPNSVADEDAAGIGGHTDVAEAGENHSDNHSDNHRDVASVAGGHDEMKPSKTLSDTEIAKLAEEFVTDDESKTEAHGSDHGVKSDKNATQHADSKGAKADGHSGKNKKGEEIHGKSELTKEASMEAPLSKADLVAKEDPHHDRIPSSVDEKDAPKSSGDHKVEAAKNRTAALPKDMATDAAGKYTVQVAAYPTETEAEKLAADLKSKGFSAFYVNAKTTDKKSWYRVSVGLFSTSKEAESYLKDLKSRGKISSAFVQKISN